MANAITLFRVGLLFAIFLILARGELTWHLLALVLTVLLIILDGVDGMVARFFHEESEAGGVFDIVVDRIVENCFWIYFAAQGIISVWIPFVIISRGFYTDGIRSIALAKGMTAFGEKTLQRSALGRAVVTSRVSRGLYGLAKVFSFLFLIIIQAVSLPGARAFVGEEWQPVIISSGYATIYLTVAFCIIRGIPVIIESRDFLFPGRSQ